MESRGGRKLQDRGYNRQGESEEITDFFTKRLCVNSKKYPNLGWKTKSGGRNIEDALWGRNTKNLIESTYFYLKISQFHVFCSDFS